MQSPQPSTPPPLLGLTFAATPEAIRGALSQITSCAANSGADQDLESALQIALAEALNNIAEHAYTGLGAGEIDVQVFPHQCGFRVQLQDSGHPMPTGLIAGSSLPPMGTSRADLPEGGFGLYLIQTLTAECSYDRIENTNRLTMDFTRKPQSKG